MPNPPIVGVRVHLHDGTNHLHDHGRGYAHRLADDILRVLDESNTEIAAYSSWVSVELVHGEPEPAAPLGSAGNPITVTYPAQPVTITWSGTANNVSVTPVDAAGDPVEQAKHDAADRIGAARIKAAEKAVADARKKQADAALALAMGVMDAEGALAALRRELGEAA